MTRSLFLIFFGFLKPRQLLSHLATRKMIFKAFHTQCQKASNFQALKSLKLFDNFCRSTITILSEHSKNVAHPAQNAFHALGSILKPSVVV